MKKIFIAFKGQKIRQKDKYYKIKQGYECWDLNKFDRDEFITSIKRKIPPVNKKLNKFYKREDATNSGLGISKEEYRDCSWGMLLPDPLKASSLVTDSYSEVISLLNLYSPHYLYPVFKATDRGIQPIRHLDLFEGFSSQNKSKIFKTTRFIDFYEQLSTQSAYGEWEKPRVEKWGKEDWRIFTAWQLFNGLRKYEFVKYPLEWQRESAEMGTIFEALLTAEESSSTEVGYKLRKRAASFIGFLFPEIEKDIRELYKQRSSFVHGSFFYEIKKKGSEMPSPDFRFLYKQKEYIRFLLVAYLNLNKLRTEQEIFTEAKNIIELLDNSIIDYELRKQIQSHTKKILRLVPRK